MSAKTKGINHSKKAKNLAGNGEVNKLLNKSGGFEKDIRVMWPLFICI